MPLTTTDIPPQKITNNKNTQLNLDRFRQDEFKDESAQCTLVLLITLSITFNAFITLFLPE
nr:palindromic element RPE3 domain-containing protein [Rickettsia rhipicephali]